MKLAQGPRNSALLDNNGFTLIEAMIAILIFVVGILGAYKLQIMATGGNTLANRVSTSTQWAAYAVEEILGKNFDHYDLNDDDGSGLDNNLNETEDDADGALYILPNGNIEHDLSKIPADHGGDAGYNAPADALYSIYWNVAIGDNDTEKRVMNDVKRIRVRVFRNGGVGDGNLYNHDYYKAKWPESKAPPGT